MLEPSATNGSSWTEFIGKGQLFCWRTSPSTLGRRSSVSVDQSVIHDPSPMTSESPILGLPDHDQMAPDDEQDPLKTPPASTTHGLPPDYDAGINTSAAWTESRDKGRSLSDEETDPNDPELDYLQVSGRPARALYSFEGKPEFREVCVSAGDAVEVIREEVGDGWSLVKLFVEEGVELGLLPRSYYTVRADANPSSRADAGLLSSLQTSHLPHPMTGRKNRVLPSHRGGLQNWTPTQLCPSTRENGSRASVETSWVGRA